MHEDSSREVFSQSWSLNSVCLEDILKPINLSGEVWRRTDDSAEIYIILILNISQKWHVCNFGIRLYADVAEENMIVLVWNVKKTVE